jgi:hypothetical protein
LPIAILYYTALALCFVWLAYGTTSAAGATMWTAKDDRCPSLW